MAETEEVELRQAARRRHAAARRRRRRRLGVAAAVVGLIAAAALAAFLLSSGDEAGSAPSFQEPSPTARAPARVYTWPVTNGASFYDVRLLLNGTSYYQVRTDEPRLQFPAGVQLAPGLYVLRVRPGFVGEQGITFGEPIPDRRLQIDG